MATVPTSNADAELAKSAWPVLEDWLSSTADGRQLLDRFTKNPAGEAGALRHWLRTHGDQAPPELSTYVYGGQVEKLVNIAQAGVVQVTNVYDGSGWWAYSQMRGLPRLLVTLGVLLALAGFACFGYSIVHAIATWNSGLAEAERACHANYSDGQLIECLGRANDQYGGGDFDVTPWIPLGAVLGFAGLALATIGSLMFRSGQTSRP
jgi:hypothetical protein